MDNNLHRALRSRMNLSQSEMAVYLGISISTIRRWESGRLKISGLAIRAIKHLYGEILGVSFEMEEHSVNDEKEKRDAVAVNPAVHTQSKPYNSEENPPIGHGAYFRKHGRWYPEGDERNDPNWIDPNPLF